MIHDHKIKFKKKAIMMKVSRSGEAKFNSKESGHFEIKEKG